MMPIPDPTLHRRLAVWLRSLADAMDQREWPSGRGGQRLHFVSTRLNLGYPVYTVSSVRGGIVMGTVGWSNQWRAWKFTPAADAVFDRHCLAEIYALMRELK